MIKIIVILLIASLITGCQGYNVKIGASYIQPDGSAIGASLEIDPSYVHQKK